jgi:hypothetical protein
MSLSIHRQEKIGSFERIGEMRRIPAIDHPAQLASALSKLGIRATLALPVRDKCRYPRRLHWRSQRHSTSSLRPDKALDRNPQIEREGHLSFGFGNESR